MGEAAPLARASPIRLSPARPRVSSSESRVPSPESRVPPPGLRLDLAAPPHPGYNRSHLPNYQRLSPPAVPRPSSTGRVTRRPHAVVHAREPTRTLVLEWTASARTPPYGVERVVHLEGENQMRLIG